MRQLSFRLVLFLLCACASASANEGELRITLVDPQGAALRGSATIVNEALGYHAALNSDVPGRDLVAKLPLGFYRLTAIAQGFSPTSRTVEVRSAIPVRILITLAVGSVSSEIDVTESSTLIDTHSPGNAMRVNERMMEALGTSSPGQAIGRTVGSQPGWLMEANGVLHPRGSEYQVQYLVDGVPFTDNRSPAYAPEIEGDHVESLTIRTGSFPAEIGRKLGGVVEIESKHDLRSGLHGEAIASRGSFRSSDAYANLQYGWESGSVALSGQAARSDRYLDPPVLDNFSNRGSVGDFSFRVAQRLNAANEIGLTLRHEITKFLIPNEAVQQTAGQRQQRANVETAGMFSYRHILSANTLFDVHVMSRDIAADLWSNASSTPIRADQDRGFRETYVKTTLSAQRGAHNLKFGAEGTYGAIREAFSYAINDPSQFPEEIAPAFAFHAHHRDREHAAFFDDSIRARNWTFTLGARVDSYRAVVSETALSPRVGIARYLPSAGLVLHAAYDRVFQTPATENLLLASSSQLDAVSGDVLRLPVRPSRGNYYEIGATKLIARDFRLDANYFMRKLSNFADDEVLLNTGVNFPVAFQSASIYGAEGKLSIAHWNKLSGFVTYSYLVGHADLPITGGLFLGDNAAQLLSSRDRVAVTQDQRNTAAVRLRYDAASRFWLAGGGSFGSGLPVEFDGTVQDALRAYGPAIVSRVNFERGRVRPWYSIDVATGVQVFKRESRAVWLQADAVNLADRLNVINFSGLFSGTALGTPRTITTKLRVQF